MPPTMTSSRVMMLSAFMMFSSYGMASAARDQDLVDHVDHAVAGIDVGGDHASALHGNDVARGGDVEIGAVHGRGVAHAGHLGGWMATRPHVVGQHGHQLIL